MLSNLFSNNKAKAFILIVLTFVIYLNVVKAGYVWDDDDYVTNNQTLYQENGLSRIWFAPGATPQYYPLVFTVLKAQYALWKDNALGYHIVNVILHILNALLLWFVLKELKIRNSYFIALIFAIHPVQVESVAWITELKNVLSGFFYLFSMYFLCRFFFRKDDKDNLNLYYAISLVFFTMALFSKTITFSLPIVMFVILWWKNHDIDKKIIKVLAPFLIVGILIAPITIMVEKNYVGAKGYVFDFSFVERILIASRALFFYPLKIIIPINLSFVYLPWGINTKDIVQYGYLFFILIIGILICQKRNKYFKDISASILFYVATILPALGFINIETMQHTFVADHYQYLASIGIIILIVNSFDLILSKHPISNLSKDIVLVASVLTLSILTFTQAALYENKIKLYSDTILKNDKCWLCFNNRGVEYLQAKEYDKAIWDFTSAIKVKAGLLKAYKNRAFCYLQSNKIDLALQDLTFAIKYGGATSDVYNMRASIYINQNQFDLALSDLSESLALNERNCFSRMNRVIVYDSLGDIQKAKDELDVFNGLGCKMK